MRREPKPGDLERGDLLRALKALERADFSVHLPTHLEGVDGEIVRTLGRIAELMQGRITRYEEQDWLKTHVAKFSRLVQGHRDLKAVAKMVLAELAPLVNAQHGVLYSQSGDESPAVLRLLATYAAPPESVPQELKLGEGLVGECAREGRTIVLEDLPADYVRLGSGLGSVAPLNVIIVPVLFEHAVKAVIELASYRPFSRAQRAFLDQLAETLGVVFNTLEANMRTEALLQQSQSLTRELQSRTAELTRTNERLEQQAQTLQRSEALLIGQQEELKLTNERIREKVAQLALTSRYKSEFLATMSHELRTPLNSLLILAKMLGDNQPGTMTAKQVEWAQNIYAAGADLLSLISDILDLAKIESGTVTLNVVPERVSDLLEFVERGFRQLAKEKGLELTIAPEGEVPAEINTDAKRLQQILKNLLSNALKFTHQGLVSLRIRTATSGWTPGTASLDEAKGVLAFDVSDTGIGIAANKHQVIFEAFRQADGSTSRAYGGTGLGLSISRELTRLLGGEIVVKSAPGQGSTFTLYLPLLEAPAAQAQASALAAPAAHAPEDDRESVRPGDRVALILDEGGHVAPALLDTVRAGGYKGVLDADAGAAPALAREMRPAAIALNLRRAGANGWDVLESLLADPATRTIPVGAFSVDALGRRCLHIAVRGLAPQPSDAKSLELALALVRERNGGKAEKVAVVERERKRRDEIMASLRAEGATPVVLDRGFEILGALRRTAFDALVVGRVPGGHESSIEWLEEVAEALPPSPPPLVLLDADGPVLALPRILEGVPELLGEVSRFLEVVARLSGTRQAEAPSARPASRELEGRRVLLVDDDIRNIYALASALEQHGVHVVEAENGKQALGALQSTPGIDIILMDLMMPELDGFDTIRIIRGLPEFRELPIIAVTAKAMAGDRERVLDAGANDYIAKPVKMEELLESMARLLHPPQGTGTPGNHGEGKDREEPGAIAQSVPRPRRTSQREARS